MRRLIHFHNTKVSFMAVIQSFSRDIPEEILNMYVVGIRFSLKVYTEKLLL